VLQGVAGKAACGEAMQPEFTAYNRAVIDGVPGAGALADAGLRIVTGGTDMGLMLVDHCARTHRRRRRQAGAPASPSTRI
jgi:glycine hydroxymethyltransferase